MVIPEAIRECVAFLMYRKAMADQPKTVGTAFFVGVYDSKNWYGSVYAVTARHVIERVQEQSPDNKVLIRAHFRDIGAAPIQTDVKDWVFHPTDDTVDVAVLLMAGLSCDKLSLSQADFKVYPLRPGSFLTPAIATDAGIGPGDEVFIVGLFSNHYGHQRNLPIVRIGNIAAMPLEKVQTNWDRREMDAYLIEARSIGGLSGSPVFVHTGPYIPRQGGFAMHQDRGGPHYLLGLVHGHWNLPVPDTDSMIEDGLNRVQVNAGIAIVVPAPKILEVLNQPTLFADREQVALEKRAREG